MLEMIKAPKSLSTAALTIAFIFVVAILAGCKSEPPPPQKEISKRVKIAPTAGGGGATTTVALTPRPGDSVKTVKTTKTGPTKPKVDWVSTTKGTTKPPAPKPKPKPAPKPKPKPKVVTKTKTPTTFKAVKRATIPAADLYVLNVASFSTVEKAEELRNRLIKDGHRAYVTIFDLKGKTWFRVRVGFFQRYSDAKSIIRQFSNDPNMRDAWVTKPSKDEVTIHMK
ncbi:MAG: SPOR domain-containing protein [Thermodesulfobacteriota bacterium]